MRNDTRDTKQVGLRRRAVSRPEDSTLPDNKFLNADELELEELVNILLLMQNAFRAGARWSGTRAGKRKLSPNELLKICRESMRTLTDIDDVVQQLSKAMLKGDAITAARFGYAYGVFDGMLITGAYALDESEGKLEAIRRQLKESRAKGGHASAKLQPEHKAVAQQIVNANCRGGARSFTAACRRAAADLARVYGISISARRLQDVLSDPTKEIA